MDELHAARKVVEAARAYYELMFGGKVTHEDKIAFIRAMEDYDEVIGNG